MGTGNFTDEFKRDAAAQITEPGYPIKEVAERLGLSLHSLYEWKRKFAKAATGETEKDVDIRRLKGKLARLSKERSILQEATAAFFRMSRCQSACKTDPFSAPNFAPLCSVEIRA